MAEDKNTPEPSAPIDPTPYIRTYAKDVAELTGKAPVASALPKKEIPEHGILLAQVDESPVEVKGGIQKEYKPEVVQTSKDDDKDVFESKKPATEKPSMFSSMPQTPITITPNVPQPTAGEREAILARLRERAGTAAPLAAPIVVPEEKISLPEPAPLPVTPAFVEPVPEPVPPPPPPPIPVPLPEPVPVPEPVLPVVPVEVPVPPPPPPVFVEPAPEPIPPIPPVAKPYAMPEFVPPAPLPPSVPGADTGNMHTFKSDFSDRIDQQQASTFSVLAAQSDAAPVPATPKKRSLVPVLIGALLIVAGIGIAGGAYYYFIHLSQPHSVLTVPSVITPDEAVELHGTTGPERMQALADLAAQPAIEGNVIVTYLTSATTTKKGILSTPQPGGVLINALPLGAPEILLRNIDPISTVGVVDSGGETKPFIIFRVTSFERTFAGMLNWEPTIGADLSILYPVPAAPAPMMTPVATTTATTTPARKKKGATPVFIAPTVAPTAILAPQFTDEVIANHDVRVLKDSLGRTILLYGYIDKQTLIIARNASAFRTLLNRLTATAGN